LALALLVLLALALIGCLALALLVLALLALVGGLVLGLLALGLAARVGTLGLFALALLARVGILRLLTVGLLTLVVLVLAVALLARCRYALGLKPVICSGSDDLGGSPESVHMLAPEKRPITAASILD